MKISEIIKNEIYADTIKTDFIHIINQEIDIIGFTLMNGDENDYLVIKAKHKNKIISFATGGDIIMQKLTKVCEHFKLTFPKTHDQIILPEQIKCMIVKLTSKNNRSYYDLSDY